MNNPIGGKTNQCIMLVAHYLKDKVAEHLSTLQKDCAGKYDVWLVYDNSRKDYDPSLVDEDTRTFLSNVQSISQKYFMTSCGKRGGLYGGNVTFLILEFYRKHPNYEYYWRIEYDMRFNGNWADLFDYFKDNNTDLLTTTLFRYIFRPDWTWWHSLKTPCYIRKRDKIRGFLPIARISKHACELLYRKFGQQWKGHEEVVVPTLLNHYRLSIEDIGGEGEFVHPENKTRFYINTPDKAGLAPGTMVCPPCAPDMPMLPGKLYHAIK
jgi:hypothetical protein